MRMTDSMIRLMILASFGLFLGLLAVATPALAMSGDYGVNSGATANSTCNGGPCSYVYGGLTYQYESTSGNWRIYAIAGTSCRIMVANFQVQLSGCTN